MGCGEHQIGTDQGARAAPATGRELDQTDRTQIGRFGQRDGDRRQD
jgi:hypothetical protein